MDIKKRIKEQGWTLEQLGAKIGVSQSAISNIVNGNPRIKSLQKIADIIGITLSELLSDDDTPDIGEQHDPRCPHCRTKLKIDVSVADEGGE